MMKDRKIMMIGGNPKAMKGKTFIENAINSSVNVYQKLRFIVHGGNNVFSVDGRLLGFRREFIQSVRVPGDVLANDRYVYFCLRAKGFQYRFFPSAIVLYRSPSSMRDHMKQNTRFIAANIRMRKYFSKSLLQKETSIPRQIRIRFLLEEFRNRPLESIFIFVINKFCNIKAMIYEKQISSKWDMAISTKHIN